MVTYYERLQSYRELCQMTYADAVEYLLDKYGAAEFDYFDWYHYERFIRFDSKNLYRDMRVTRGSEGLECHHIDENIFSGLSTEIVCRDHKIPHKYQKADRLVYCDMIEHLILHALIAYETSGKFGIDGYQEHMRVKIETVYVNREPVSFKKKEVQRNKARIERSFLEPYDAQEILDLTDMIVSTGIYYN